MALSIRIGHHTDNASMERFLWLTAWVVEHDVHIDIEGAEKHNQSIQGKTGIASTHELGDIGLFETKPLGRLSLIQLQGLDALANLSSQLGLDLQIPRIGKPKIDENIIASFNDRDVILFHLDTVHHSYIFGQSNTSISSAMAHTVDIDANSFLDNKPTI